jgi:hypothetical protein
MSSIALTQEPEIEQIIYSEPENTVQEDFKIDDQEKASWAARRILHAQKTIEERKVTAKRFKERIDTWLTQSNEPDERTIEYLSSLLQPSRFARNPRRSRSSTRRKHSLTARNMPRMPSSSRRSSQDGTLIPGVLLDGGEEKLYVKE